MPVEDRYMDRKKAMVLGSFIGDSLALGVHWIYDTREILEDYGRVTSFVDPSPELYHPNRKKGEFTHYGDQTLVLLEAIAGKGYFDPGDFSYRWRSLFENYDGYIDQATRTTLRNYSLGKTWECAASSSEDLAGSSRIAPVVYRYAGEPGMLVEACKSQTRITHNHPLVVEAAEFLARTTRAVLGGTKPVKAMKETMDSLPGSSELYDMFRTGLESVGEETTAAIARLGQGCGVSEAFPSVVHLIAGYEEDFERALIECVMAGGDSAARAMIIGMVLGAYLGRESIPGQWLSGLKAREKIEEHLRQIDEKM